MFLKVCPDCLGRSVPDAGTSALSWALLTCQGTVYPAGICTEVLSLSGCSGLRLLIHLLSQFFINTLGFTASCWIKYKVCKYQLLAYSLLQQHWEGFFQLSASSCHSNSLWLNYTQPNFSSQLLRSHKGGLFPKSLSRNLWTRRERDIRREDQTGGSKRGDEPNSRFKTGFFSIFVVI